MNRARDRLANAGERIVAKCTVSGGGIDMMHLENGRRSRNIDVYDIKRPGYLMSC